MSCLLPQLKAIFSFLCLMAQEMEKNSFFMRIRKKKILCFFFQGFAEEKISQNSHLFSPLISSLKKYLLKPYLRNTSI